MNACFAKAEYLIQLDKPPSSSPCSNSWHHNLMKEVTASSSPAAWPTETCWAAYWMSHQPHSGLGAGGSLHPSSPRCRVLSLGSAAQLLCVLSDQGCAKLGCDLRESKPWLKPSGWLLQASILAVQRCCALLSLLIQLQLLSPLLSSPLLSSPLFFFLMEEDFNLSLEVMHPMPTSSTSLHRSCWDCLTLHGGQK